MSDEQSVKKVDILGSEWTIEYKDEDPMFEEAQGYAESNERKIVIENVKVSEDPKEINLQAQYVNQKRILRHELIHAFLSESGLEDSSTPADAWATNEEMADWFARQSPKIYKVYKELNLL